MQERIFFDVSSDNYFDVIGLQNKIDLTYPADATLVATIYTRAGAAVVGATNLAGAFVTGTSGADTAYRFFVQDTVTLPMGTYEIRGTATKAGVVWKFFAPLTVQKG